MNPSNRPAPVSGAIPDVGDEWISLYPERSGDGSWWIRHEFLNGGFRCLGRWNSDRAEKARKEAERKAASLALPLVVYEDEIQPGQVYDHEIGRV